MYYINHIQKPKSDYFCTLKADISKTVKVMYKDSVLYKCHAECYAEHENALIYSVFYLKLVSWASFPVLSKVTENC